MHVRPRRDQGGTAGLHVSKSDLLAGECCLHLAPSMVYHYAKYYIQPGSCSWSTESVGNALISLYGLSHEVLASDTCVLFRKADLSGLLFCFRLNLAKEGTNGNPKKARPGYSSPNLLPTGWAQYSPPLGRFSPFHWQRQEQFLLF